LTKGGENMNEKIKENFKSFLIEEWSKLSDSELFEEFMFGLHKKNEEKETLDDYGIVVFVSREKINEALGLDEETDEYEDLLEENSLKDPKLREKLDDLFHKEIEKVADSFDENDLQDYVDGIYEENENFELYFEEFLPKKSTSKKI
jgi:hypothetical protein